MRIDFGNKLSILKMLMRNRAEEHEKIGGDFEDDEEKPCEF